MAKELKDFRHQNKALEYDNKKAVLVVGLLRLKNDMKNMPEDEVKNKGLDLLKNIIEKIIEATHLIDDM